MKRSLSSLKDSKGYLVGFAVIVTFAFVLLLSFVNELTKDRVKKNQELFLIRAVLESMRIPYRNDQDALMTFQTRITVEEIQGQQIFITNPPEERKYAILFSGNGLWSIIQGVLGVDAKFERVTGLSFVEQNETPGLGGRIEESWFKAQFQGEKLIDRTIAFRTGQADPGDPDKENGSVDAVTGATSTSKSLETILKNALIDLEERIREGNR
ncbi:MAG TPA: FMN-binding protein [Thermotogota bacterium]|nr:FMN-binding protein [Thermotogota bacterium]HNT95198.1 FMN-binding protein [Thermotogota bacterium]